MTPTESILTGSPPGQRRSFGTKGGAGQVDAVWHAQAPRCYRTPVVSNLDKRVLSVESSPLGTGRVIERGGSKAARRDRIHDPHVPREFEGARRITVEAD